MGRLHITRDTVHIEGLAADAASPLAETLIGSVGPQLALAEAGIFCLHASAVLAGGRAVLFLGESGAGKSTLAARLDAYGGIRRLADDISPVQGADLLPHIPQLKLQPGTLHPRDLPERVPIGAIYRLAPADTVTARPVGPGTAAATLIRHTFATVAFPPATRQRHLAACGQLASRVPVIELGYPRIPAAIDAVHALLNAR